MFERKTTDFGGMRRVTLHHPTLGHAMSLVPEQGATLTDLRFFGTNVLEGYEKPEELGDTWCKSAILFPFPNRLRDGRYTWLGKDYAFPVNEAPTQTAIHGFVRYERFREVSVETTEDHAEIQLQMESPGTNPGYPFPFRLDLFFRMTLEPRLTVGFRVRNLHTTAIPVGFGWHPYFRLAPRLDDHFMFFPACERVEIDERMLPTGKRVPYDVFAEERLVGETTLDTCFRVRDEVSSYRLSLRAPGHSMFIEANRDGFPFFQVYTPPWRGSVALEPMTCNIDAFRNGEGLVSLDPGATWERSFTIGYLAEG